MTYSTEPIAIAIPFSASDRQTADRFAHLQPTPEKQTQVRQNTLAVLAVHHYLQLLDVATNLRASDSWNPVGQLCANIADLVLPNRGRLECRPVNPGDRFSLIPPEVGMGRLGYVFVQLEETQGVILGFVRTASERIDLRTLQPLETLLSVLHLPTPANRLSQWLNGVFAEGWQTLDRLLGEGRLTPALAFRNSQIQVDLTQPEILRQQVAQLYERQRISQQVGSSVNSGAVEETWVEPIAALVQFIQTTDQDELRWTAAELLWTVAPDHPAAGVRRALDLGMQLAGRAIALVVAVLPQPDQNFSILLRLYPMDDQPYLPEGLKLTGLDELGNPFLQAESRSWDDYIQLKFGTEPGEQFSVRLTLGQACVVEHFVV